MSTKFVPVMLLLLPLVLFAGTQDPDRDFAGNWVLDAQQSDSRALTVNPGALLTISQQGSTIQCTESGATWSFHIDGSDSRYRLRDSSMNAESKWEGSALLINTLVSGPQSYVIEDRWQMSRDRSTLRIERTIRRGTSEAAATLVYHNRERLQTVARAAPTAGAPALIRTPVRGQAFIGQPPPPAEFIVRAGTKIPLALINSLSTKHSSEGDRVYLETVYPITQSGRIIIPRGSYVAGTVTEVKRAGKFKGKAEMFLRFDSLTLPNGVTRDFRARLDSADTGDVDRREGKIQGDSNKGGDARTVGEAAGAGASVGAIAGSVAHHAGTGALIGGVGGAAAGLAAVMLTRGPDLVLPKGTTVEMVLDRPLRFQPRELGIR
jgi:hypothetical protein